MVDRKLLHSKIRELLQTAWDSSLEPELPRKWEKHGNCILFPSTALTSPVFKKHSKLYPLICDLMKVKKVARKSGSITPGDSFRRPQVELLFGSDGWVERTENGIKYRWDITKCMFSSGNISEKQRISSWDLKGQTVVDLYAGIGYFTLSYLVHAKCEKVFACEWNPDALEALENNLKLNKVQEKCEILAGDNVLMCPEKVADHVNLGLIPSSEHSWKVACRALKPSGGILHIHGNVDLKESLDFQNDDQLGDFLERNSSNGFEYITMEFSSQDSTEFPTKYSSHFSEDAPATKNGIEPAPQVNTCTYKNKKNNQKNEPISDVLPAWHAWSIYVNSEIASTFKKLYPHDDWNTQIVDVVKIKSYGPCVDHIVVDIRCWPAYEDNNSVSYK